MSKYLGIDYGDKRIGIAISDEEGRFAFPRDVVLNEQGKLQECLDKIIEKENISAIIVGLPLNFRMKDTAQTTKVRRFGKFLQEKFHKEVIFENEILSTKESERFGGSTKEMIDASSAALILQSYLSRLK
ncbi:Holliday junction resolvase RuvX [Candidatus Giovannonibacteria bacterium]|nr:Holliday junction resolvase RuvX [Candidatus Giovannonibacteria bacterium]